MCVDCGTPTALALVDADALEVVWLCPGCLTARYSTTLGHGRHLEEGAP